MGMYLMMMYVSLEQEEAVKHFFSTKGWSFQKPDLSVLTDRTGPLVIPVSEPTLAPTDPGTPEQTEAGRKPVTGTHTSTSVKTKTSPQQQQKKGKVTTTKRSANTEKREFEEILKEAEIIAASVSEIGESEENEGTETSVKMEQERESFIMEQTDNYDDTYDDYDDFNGGEKGETEVSKIEFVKDSVTQGPSDDTLTRRKRKLGDRSELSEMEDFGDSQEAAIKALGSRKKRLQYNRVNIQRAFDATQKGMSVYKASRKFGVPESTLRDRTRGNVEVDAKPGVISFFSEKEEENLVQYIIQMNKTGKNYNVKSIRKLAKDYALLLGKDVKAAERLSSSWYYKFRQRWPEIPVAAGQPSQPGNEDSIQEEDRDTYYRKLGALLNKR